MTANDTAPTEFVPWTSPLMLGLFIPLQNGAWSPSLAPRGTDWSFDYNLKCVRMAEEIGFDFVFGLGQWHRSGGWGGTSRYHEQHLDPLVVAGALAAATERIGLISTTHVLYGWHPTLLAKLCATVDHVSGGRFGLNVVTGYKPFEYGMFGLDPIPHDERYALADEFIEAMKLLWRSPENVDLDGHWTAKDAFVTPKPARGRPMIVNAGSSGPGLDFAARHSDMLFITSPVGLDAPLDEVVDALPEYIAGIHRRTATDRPRLRIVINPHVICRDTAAEAQAAYREIVDNPDVGAVEGTTAILTGGDHSSWKSSSGVIDTRTMEKLTVGGNLTVVGDPEQVVEQLLRLSKCGVDGVQINFFDYLPDLERFGARVMPLLEEVGLR
ncbi:LLM class flavin-dependent oxidoreductase [Pseudonocardia xishanensis]|uniref:LLM class flavin-dependent oxidoreductase n=1 Tax=Pseudonocardia xishanensis TaxID=630995 RepID=A0ABP8REZ2_9PSEU